jgi:hypothetical protein
MVGENRCVHTMFTMTTETVNGNAATRVSSKSLFRTLALDIKLVPFPAFLTADSTLDSNPNRHSESTSASFRHLLAT